MKTYLENGTYMFHALAFDEFANEQADDSETDGSKISVTVENSYRPAPEVFGDRGGSGKYYTDEPG